MTDDQMLALLDSDPSEGIKRLIECYSALVYNVVYGKLGNVLSPDDIEECVGFVFVNTHSLGNCGYISL